MPAKRLSMRKIYEILRLCWEKRLTQREVAHSISVSPSTVSDCLCRASAAGLNWPLDPGLDDAALEAKLYPPATQKDHARVMPDFEYIQQELRRKGVTLMLLWQEYKQDHPNEGYQYSQFCEHYGRYKNTLDVVLRQEHRAGEKMFVDFSGDGIEITDPKKGMVSEAELFVAVLGASNYTYAEAFPSEKLRFWIQGHIHAYEYFEGVAAATVPDNTKVAVTHPCYYEPDINKTYLEMARFYNTAILPARARKPRDKPHTSHCAPSVLCGDTLPTRPSLPFVLDGCILSRRFIKILRFVVICNRFYPSGVAPGFHCRRRDTQPFCDLLTGKEACFAKPLIPTL